MKSSKLGPEILAQLREVFFEEAAGLVDSLEADLLALEQQDDSERLNNAFRAAHTIKGSAASAGVEEVAQFIHRIESVLDQLRSRRMSFSADLLSLLLEGVDRLRGLLSAVHAGKPLPQEEHYSERLEQWLGDPSRQSLLAQGATRVAVAAVSYRVRFVLPRDAFNFGLDPLTLLNALSAEAAVMTVHPLLEGLPPLEELDPFGCYLGFEAIVQPMNGLEDLQAVFEFCPEGTELSLTPLTEDHENVPAEESVTVQSAKNIVGEESRSLRVKQERLDHFMNLVGELVTARNMLLHLQKRLEDQYDLPELARSMKETNTTVSRVVSDLQNEVLTLRMVPLKTVFQRLPRVVRDVAVQQEKQAVLRLSGDETEVDKTVADALVDPLVHMIRNAVDHGLERPEQRRANGKPEEGQVEICAWQEGRSVLLEVRDDGAGIDPSALRQAAVQRGLLSQEAAAALNEAETLDLIFAPGLSTTQEVTEISGRGVGMDVVRSNVQKMGGTIQVETQAGKGTTFRLSVPLTLSLFRALILSAGGETFALPMEAVKETVVLTPGDWQTLRGRSLAAIRDHLVGMTPLAEAMGLEMPRQSPESWDVVVLESGGQRIGVMVDRVESPQEITVKPLESYLMAGGAISGASVMGNGKIALVLDPPGLIAALQAHLQDCGASRESVR